MVGHLKFRVFSFLKQPFIADDLRSITHKRLNAFFSVALELVRRNFYGSRCFARVALIAKFVHLTLCSWMLTLCFYQLANNGCSGVCRPLEGTWCGVIVENIDQRRNVARWRFKCTKASARNASLCMLPFKSGTAPFGTFFWKSETLFAAVWNVLPACVLAALRRAVFSS